MGERIKQIRTSLNLTQEEFAIKLGMGRSSIAAFESGRPIKNRII
ncbi:helix-turn-helix transcriptional regulator, partial [Clostridium sp.]